MNHHKLSITVVYDLYPCYSVTKKEYASREVRPKVKVCFLPAWTCSNSQHH